MVVGLYVQDLHLFHGGIGIVHDVVDGPREGKDVLAVDGRHKGPVEVIDQNETPGLGGRISEMWFKEQFRGKISPLTKVAEGEQAGKNQFQAVTGATYSTNAVMDIVNLTSDEIPELIGKHQ